MTWRWGPRRLGFVVGLVGALVMAGRLLLPNPIGMTGGEDAQAISCALSVRLDVPADVDPDAYVHLSFDAHRWQGEVCDDARTGTSHLAVLRLAQIVGGVVGTDGGLDLRVVGVLLSIAFGIALGSFAWAVPGTVATRATMSGLIAVVVLDAGVAGALGSLRGEGTAAVAAVAVLAAACRLLCGPATGARRAAFIATSAVLVTATPQAVWLAPVLALGLLVGRGTARRDRSVRVGCAVLVLAAALVASAQTSDAQRSTARADRLLGGILQESDDVPRDLRSLDLSPETATVVGTVGPASSDPLRRAAGDVSSGEVGRLLVRRPTLAVGMLRRSVDAASRFGIPPGAASQVEHGDRPPYSPDTRITAASIAFEAFDAFPALLVVLWAGCAGVARRLRRGTCTDAARGLSLVTTGLVLAAASLVVAVPFADGLDHLPRNLLLAQIATTWCAPLLVAALLANRRTRPALVVPPDGDGAIDAPSAPARDAQPTSVEMRSTMVADAVPSP